MPRKIDFLLKTCNFITEQTSPLFVIWRKTENIHTSPHMNQNVYKQVKDICFANFLLQYKLCSIYLVTCDTYLLGTHTHGSLDIPTFNLPFAIRTT